jgi:hypothetical protein
MYWCEMLTEEYTSLVHNEFGAHVVRAFARAVGGLGRQAPFQTSAKIPPMEEAASNKRRTQLSTIQRNCCTSILRIGLDWPSVVHYVNMPSISMCVQVG